MSLLSRYLIGLVVRPMLAIVVVALAVLLAERMLRVLDIVIGWRGSMLVLLEMLGYLVPHYMGVALPAAFFIAILLVFSRLSRDGEIDAILAAGRGLHELLRPLVAIGFLLLAINAVIVSHLQPYSRYAYRAALFALSNVTFLTLIRERAFVTLAGTTYAVERLSPERDRLEGLVLFSRMKDGSTLTITARRGRILAAEGDQPIRFDLEDGVHQLVPAPGEDGAERPAATVRFRSFTTDLEGAEPKPFRPRGEDERELTLPELRAALDRPVKGIDPPEIEAGLHGRLVAGERLPSGARFPRGFCVGARVERYHRYPLLSTTRDGTPTLDVPMRVCGHSIASGQPSSHPPVWSIFRPGREFPPRPRATPPTRRTASRQQCSCGGGAGHKARLVRDGAMQHQLASRG
jgi:lipopolysaccharide export system permease protein